MPKTPKVEVVVGPMILAWSNLFEPRKVVPKAQEARYDATFLVEEEAVIQRIRGASREAALLKWEERYLGAHISNPMKDGSLMADKAAQKVKAGEAEYDKEWARGKFVLVASADLRHPPDVRIAQPDGSNTVATRQEDFYPGICAYAVLAFMPYEHGSNEGVTAKLQAVLKKADGEPLFGRRDFGDCFTGIKGEVTDEDPLAEKGATEW